MSKRNFLFSAALPFMALGFASGAAAQQAASDPVVTTPVAAVEEEADDEIVITGSRIKRESTQALDVTVIGSEQIEARGFTNILNALIETPGIIIGSSRLGANNQNGANNAFVDLLGLGSQRTLTLVDGKRFISSNQNTVFVPQNATGSQVDLTIINPALIERSETLTVGGGPIYGADAVAGVVNIILKRDFEGFTATAQGGLTQYGDGSNYRVTGVWGKNFNNDRGNITLAGEWLDSSIIRGGQRREFSNLRLIAVNNPRSLSTTDGIPNQLFQAGAGNAFTTAGGTIQFGVNSVGLGGPIGQIGAAATLIYPNTAGQGISAAAFNAFVAATGLSPFAFSQTAAGAQIDPALFLGTFGSGAGFLQVPNTDPRTSAFLPRRAVPLRFDTNGNLVPINLGQFSPNNLANQTIFPGPDAFNVPEQTNIASGQERISANLLFSYKLTSHLTYKGDFLFSDIENRSADAAPANSPTGALTAGSLGIPIFIDQNPFVSAQALTTLNGLEAQRTAGGLAAFQRIGGQRVLFLDRTLFDLNGGLNAVSGDDSRTYRTTHSLSGDFNLLNRNFTWETAFVYGRNQSVTVPDRDFRDIEFALATDVVIGPNGQPVCRQQTLAAPERINIRNPGVGQINTQNPTGLVPTAAQVAACVPLNLLGEGRFSQAALDYVSGFNQSRNLAQQYYVSGNLGGELFNLPGGALQFNSQLEWRRESLDFRINDVFDLGLGRTTTGNASRGAVQTLEGGTEFVAPVFGNDFRVPGIHDLELNGAVRVVSRGGNGTDPSGGARPVNADGTVNVTWTGGGRYSPIEDITFRGNRTKSIRSASVNELFGAPQTAFSNAANALACNGINASFNIPQATANCATYAASIGTTAAALAALLPANAAIPAGTAGNPGLSNEIANSWTVGVVVEPRFIPGLTLTSDYINIQIDGQISLAFPAFDCFDSVNFPNSIVGGVNTCANTVPGVLDPASGQFIVPLINPITGQPTIPSAGPGQVATSQQAGTLAYAQFSQLNQGSTLLQSLNSTINYRFGINDALTFARVPPTFDLGDLTLRGTVYYILRFDDSASGRFDDINPRKGEPGFETYTTRLDVIHSLGKLTQQLQWFRTGSSLTNVQSTAVPDQLAGFALPAFNTFNYNVGYDITENLTARVIVNNLTNAQLFPGAGVAGDTIGRSFVFTLQARF